ncbi:TetR/AcrR family transcriptional regulator [Streptomyces sp. NPDC048603]|uniref:TetR/AcrR family transcriptional regulator n=1 Tax=Streptomyces sp. NPDC048603 TaxID=3365577 RepID=UPI0037122ABF
MPTTHAHHAHQAHRADRADRAGVRAASAEERRVIARAARTLFARRGWTRTTVEAVAAEAGVPVDSVERCFQDKEQLLLAVLMESSAFVAAALTAIAEEHLGDVGDLTDTADLESELIALGHAWLTPLTAFREHFAIVRHLSAEITSLPAQAAEKWQSAGPRQARGALARRLRHVADQGLLGIPDADQAADRFILLVPSGVVQRSFHGAVPLGPEETHALIADGVADFIRLYGRHTSR